MADNCPKCGEPGGAKYTHVCSSRAAVAKYAGTSQVWVPTAVDRALPWELRKSSGLAFRLLICDRCRAVWPTERDDAHGGSRSDGEPCAYAYAGSTCKGRVWPLNGVFPDQGQERPRPRPRAPGEWQVGDNRWRAALGLAPGERDLGKVRRRYRELAKQHHPDHGGDAAKMAAINEAYTDALAELGQPG
ncbi:MAG TPA: J domain-containing protein [Trebonia sp.]|jgi:hypothetical protein|nr:J domain-containing protein [Trebonia sp.]